MEITIHIQMIIPAFPPTWHIFKALKKSKEGKAAGHDARLPVL